MTSSALFYLKAEGGNAAFKCTSQTYVITRSCFNKFRVTSSASAPCFPPVDYILHSANNWIISPWFLGMQHIFCCDSSAPPSHCRDDGLRVGGQRDNKKLGWNACISICQPTYAQWVTEGTLWPLVFSQWRKIHWKMTRFRAVSLLPTFTAAAELQLINAHWWG